MSYRIVVQEPSGYEEEYFANTMEIAYERGLEEVQICEDEYATFIIEDEESGVHTCYSRDGDELW